MKKVLCLFLLFLIFNGCTPSVSNEIGVARLSLISIVPSDPSPLLPLNQGEEKMIPWRSSIGTTKYDWNGKDLLVTPIRAGTTRMFYSIWREDLSNMALEDKKTSQTIDSFLLPLAIVGDLVSFQHEMGYLSGASAWSEWRFETRNISKPGTPISLTHYFSDDEIFRSLMSNERITQGLQKAIAEKKTTSPDSLSQLSKVLTTHDYTLFEGEFALEEDYLTRFAFHHVDGSNIVVWITLRPTSHSGQAMQDYIEISLPVPQNLETDMNNADSQKAGFLMKDSLNTVGTKSAEFLSKIK